MVFDVWFVTSMVSQTRFPCTNLTDDHSHIAMFVFLFLGASPTAEALLKSGTKQASGQTVRPKQQLLYLAEVLGFQVQYTDFPKVKIYYRSLLNWNRIKMSLSTNDSECSKLD